MAKDDEAVPERALLASYEGEFHVVALGTRMLVNGNKIRVTLEAEYDGLMLAQMASFMDKDARVRFKELVSKKTRKKTGDEDSKHLFGEGEEVGPA
jgi:hypothetical protein